MVIAIIILLVLDVALVCLLCSERTKYIKVKEELDLLSITMPKKRKTKKKGGK